MRCIISRYITGCGCERWFQVRVSFLLTHQWTESWTIFCLHSEPSYYAPSVNHKKRRAHVERKLRGEPNSGGAEDRGAWWSGVVCGTTPRLCKIFAISKKRSARSTKALWDVKSQRARLPETRPVSLWQLHFDDYRNGKVSSLMA